MDGTHSFLTRLRAVLRGLDDEALATLANKGLLRRARKDLDGAPPEIIAIEADCVRLQVADATVEMPELPSKATCTCPATGICRHILTALIYIRDNAGMASCGATQQTAHSEAADPEAPAPPSPAEVLANLSDKDLQKWAGKALLRKAVKTLAADPPVEIETAGSLVVRFPSRNITCRWIPAGGLTGMICSCQAETVCEHVVAAVLAYQVSLGKRQIAPEEAVLRESAGAPRSRIEVLASVGTVLGEIISLGLSRLSAATANRLTTLAVSAHGVDLPRLERMLKSVSDEVELALRRDAQSSSANLLLQAARIEALRLGLGKSEAAALVGQHRTQYHDVGQLTLVGLGAYCWRAKSGYHGLTLCFWDELRKDWATWSDSRPATLKNFDPASRFQAEGPWSGCSSPRQAASSIVRLTRAWRNPLGRISGRGETRALVVGPSRPAEVPAGITDWSDIAQQAKRLFGDSLAERTENLDLVLLRPNEWGPPFYNPLRQELLRPVADEHGRMVHLWLPFTPENECAVDLLERHDPADTSGLLGSLRLVSGQVRVQPISLFVGEKIVHLTLDRHSSATEAAARKAAPAEAEMPVGDEEDSPPPATAATPLGRLLITAQAELEALAESGIAVRRDLELLRGAGKRLEALGLGVCGRPILNLVDSLRNSAELSEPEFRDRAAVRLLHAYYILRLAADYETTEAGCRGLQ